MEKRDRSTPLGNIVASATRIAADMQPKRIAKSFSICFFSTQRQSSSVNRFLIIENKLINLNDNHINENQQSIP